MSHAWILALGTGLLMLVIGFATFQSGKLLQRWSPPFNLLLSLPENVVRLGLIALIVALAAFFGPGAAALGWGTARLLPDILLGCLVALVLAPVLAGGGQLIVRYWGQQTYNTRVLRAVLPANGGEWAGVLIALLPAAALEELLFRSLPLGGLASLISPWWLLWPLALLFGLLHWPQGAWGVAGTAVISVALSVLFIITGSIWAPLAAHYLLNVLQIFFAHRSGYRPLRRS